MQSFDLQDTLFDLFRYNVDLQSILSITDPNDIATVDQKMRRQSQDPTLLDPNDSTVFPFFDYSFVDARATGNYLVNNGLLEFNIYASNRYVAMQIYKVVKGILNDNFEDMQIVAEGQASLPISNIYCYRFRVKPMISS